MNATETSNSSSQKPTNPAGKQGKDGKDPFIHVPSSAESRHSRDEAGSDESSPNESHNGKSTASHPEARLGFKLPVIIPPNQLLLPNSPESRLTSPKGRYFPMDPANLKAFTLDHAVVFSRTYKELSNPGGDTFTWDFYGPRTDKLTSRRTSASVQWTYKSCGKCKSDHKASYKLEVKVWDLKHPGGHKVKEALIEQLCPVGNCT